MQCTKKGICTTVVHFMHPTLLALDGGRKRGFNFPSNCIQLPLTAWPRLGTYPALFCRFLFHFGEEGPLWMLQGKSRDRLRAGRGDAAPVGDCVRHA